MDARWAADGASLYYLLLGANASEVRRALVLPDGPDPSPSIVQNNLTVQDSVNASIAISRHGRLAYPRVSLDRDIWRADVSPSLSSHEPIPLRAVTSGTRSDEPRFSPDGKRIVFARQDGELGQVLLASAEGEIQMTLVSRKGSAAVPVLSPDGESVAYWFDDGNGPALHVSSVRSRADRVFKPLDAPAHLEWAPGARLVYHAAGSWTHTLIDPKTGEEGPLVEPEDGTSHYSPRYSNRGDRIAFYYNARTKRGVVGLAIVSLQDRRVRLIPDTPSFLRPIGWSSDDACVYAVDEGSGQLVAVRTDGKGIRTMGRLPSRKTFGGAVEIGGKLKLVFSYPNDRSDIWVVDNFDGGRR